MKLLRAFIEASGYEIEEVTLSPLGLRGGELRMMGAVIDYKVTKKPDPLDVMYDGVSLLQLVENVYQESEWIKYPKESFYAVIKWFGDEAERINEHRYNINGVEVSLND